MNLVRSILFAIAFYPVTVVLVLMAFPAALLGHAPVAAVTHGSPATYNSTTGQLNPAAAGVAIASSRYLTSAGAGELALLRLTAPAAGA